MFIRDGRGHVHVNWGSALAAVAAGYGHVLAIPLYATAPRCCDSWRIITI